jgi:hypothetical protein
MFIRQYKITWPEHEVIAEPKQKPEKLSVKNKKYFSPFWPGTFMMSMSMCRRYSGRHSHGSADFGNVQ